MAAYTKKPQGAAWRKSSYSSTGGGQCVEVATARTSVAVRDSKAPESVVLRFPAAAWVNFLAATRHDRI